MPSPFPGMDPYLEHPDLWPGFHASLLFNNCDRAIIISSTASKICSFGRSKNV